MNTITTYKMIKETKPVWKAVGCPNGGRALWLQRVLFWVLRKLKAQYITHETTYDRIEIDPKKAVNILVESQRNLFDLMGGASPARYAVMGQTQLNECIDSARSFSTSPFMFHVQFPGKGGMKIFGLDVIVVPWIDGCFVLPDLENIR